MLFLPALRDEIEAKHAQFVAAFNRQDAGAISEMYTDDGTVMPTGSDSVQGKDSRHLVAIDSFATCL